MKNHKNSGVHILRVRQELHCYKMLVCTGLRAVPSLTGYIQVLHIAHQCVESFIPPMKRKTTAFQLCVWLLRLLLRISCTDTNTHTHTDIRLADIRQTASQGERTRVPLHWLAQQTRNNGTWTSGCLCLPVCVSLQSLHISCAWFQFEGMLWSAKSWHSSVLSSYESGGITLWQTL